MTTEREIELRRALLIQAEETTFVQLEGAIIDQKTLERMRIVNDHGNADAEFAQVKRNVRTFTQRLGVIRDELKKLPEAPKVAPTS